MDYDKVLELLREYCNEVEDLGYVSFTSKQCFLISFIIFGKGGNCYVGSYIDNGTTICSFNSLEKLKMFFESIA